MFFRIVCSIAQVSWDFRLAGCTLTPLASQIHKTLTAIKRQTQINTKLGTRARIQKIAFSQPLSGACWHDEIHSSNCERNTCSVLGSPRIKQLARVNYMCVEQIVIGQRYILVWRHQSGISLELLCKLSCKYFQNIHTFCRWGRGDTGFCDKGPLTVSLDEYKVFARGSQRKCFLFKARPKV